ncbi:MULTISPECIES: hypothetical protein [Acidiphilium]|uniref:hypothetical protein n=1 Tax=Acidiphilium TaxID=522 RepID=UPI00257C9345|nr:MULTISPECIES: hypothetical protein [Acidiphilium]HQT86620.1 hypothetical protein [Acidiphilium rubrum]
MNILRSSGRCVALAGFLALAGCAYVPPGGYCPPGPPPPDPGAPATGTQATPAGGQSSVAPACTPAPVVGFGGSYPAYPYDGGFGYSGFGYSGFGYLRVPVDRDH